MGCLRSEEHTSELQSRGHIVCRLLPHTYIFTVYLHDALPISKMFWEKLGFHLKCVFKNCIIEKCMQKLHFLNKIKAGDLVKKKFTTVFIISVILAIIFIVWGALDRKSTRLNSSHVAISYAVFCRTPTSLLFTYTTLFRSQKCFGKNWAFT